MLFPSWPGSCCPSFLEGLGWRGYNPGLPQCQVMYPRNATEGGLGVLAAWLMGFWSQLFIFYIRALRSSYSPHVMRAGLSSLLLLHPNTSQGLSGLSPPPSCSRRMGKAEAWWGARGRRWFPTSFLLTWLPPFHFLHKVGSRIKGFSFFLFLPFLTVTLWCLVSLLVGVFEMRLWLG